MVVATTTGWRKRHDGAYRPAAVGAAFRICRVTASSISPIRRPADPPTRRPADPPIRRPADPPIRRSADPPTRRPADPPIHRSTDPPIHRSTDPPTHPNAGRLHRPRPLRAFARHPGCIDRTNRPAATRPLPRRTIADPYSTADTRRHRREPSCRRARQARHGKRCSRATVARLPRVSISFSDCSRHMIQATSCAPKTCAIATRLRTRPAMNGDTHKKESS